MRQITADCIRAFINHRVFRRDNTQVEIDNNGSASLYLHGNLIAVHHRGGDIQITNAGWVTNVTKERLNGIPGVSISQRKGKWYLNDRLWDGSWVKV
ncbi:MAG: hypothetical protein IE936_09635 [Moraxella osloensis]|nr:hypothetical protein [Moraxella osloensis]